MRIGGKPSVRKRTARLTKPSGFTLVEILVALLLAGLLVSAVSAVLLGSVNRKVRQEERITALFLAQEGLERWIALDGGSSPSGIEVDRSVPGFPGYSREIRWEEPGQSRLRRATVEVRSPDGLVRLETIHLPREGG